MSVSIQHNIKNSGLNGLQEKHLNDNFKSLFQKLHEGIGADNIDTNLRNIIKTHIMSFTDNGNYDVNYPFIHRFYIQDNNTVKEIKNANISVVSSRYRLDSVTLDQEGGSSIILNETTTGSDGASGYHTHNLISLIDLPFHFHPIKEKITVSIIEPANVKVYVNNTLVGTVANGSNQRLDNVNFKNAVKIGWNEIKVTCSNVARAEIFGTVEYVLK